MYPKAKLLALLLFSSIFFAMPFATRAAEAIMFLSASSGVYPINKDLSTRLIINTGGGLGINAAESVITFNPAQVKVKKITKDVSVFDLWAKQPSIDNKKGTIKFSGGTTKANKSSAAVVLTIIFTPLKTGQIDIKLSTTTSSVLAADGYATNILTKVGGASFIIGNSAKIKDADAYRDKMKGRFLYYGSKKGSLWYINPANKLRYELNGATSSLDVLRRLGTKIKHANFLKYSKSGFAKTDLGKVLIDTEDKNKAYYINPSDKKPYLLDTPTKTYDLVKKFGQTVTADAIKKIPDWTI
jgi:hypothetical protein